LTRQQINYQVSQVRMDIRQRSLLYHGDKRPIAIAGRTVIIVDDGLASGYTMRAAIESIRHRKPEKIVAAVPVGPEGIINEVRRIADSVIACAVGTEKVFYLSDYCMKEWRMRRFRPEITLPEKKTRQF
jgi:putative phosphoribosyl transferase